MMSLLGRPTAVTFLVPYYTALEPALVVLTDAARGQVNWRYAKSVAKRAQRTDFLPAR